MLALGMIASTLVFFAGIFGVLSLACHIADHDWLVMLHMYFSSALLSLASGLILPLKFEKLNALRGQLKKRTPFS